MQAPDVWAYIQHTYSRDDLRATAQRWWAKHAPNLFHSHAVELSSSDAGKCVLEVWAKLHGELNLPENHATELAKMDGGTMYGLRVACLFAASFEDEHPEYAVELEVVSDHDGIPGHIDIVIATAVSRMPVWVIEIKTSFWPREFSGEQNYHVLQAGKYALGQAVPDFSLFYVLPAQQKTKGVEPPFHAQRDFATAGWADRVNAEYARLRAATSDAAPEQDVKEGWRCNSCRYGACPKNARYEEAVA
jgi:hypothetical protein